MCTSAGVVVVVPSRPVPRPQFCCEGEKLRGAGGGRRGREVPGGPGPGPGKMLRGTGGPAQRLEARGALQRGSS